MGCKICGSDVRTIHDQQFDIDYFHCSNCDLIFIDDKKIVSQERELNEYNRHNNSLECEGYVNMFRQFISKTVTPYRDRVNKMLDFGSGPEPVLAHLLREEGFKVDIYDPYYSPEKVYKNKKYDMIVSTEVFEHFCNPLETITEIISHLDKGGVLAFMTLFHPQDDEQFKKWWYRRDPTHITFYSHKTIQFLADKFNMKLIYIDNKNTCVLEKL